MARATKERYNAKTKRSPPPPACLLLSRDLCTETVKSSALSFEGVYNIERGDSLPLGVFSVCDRVTNNILKATPGLVQANMRGG